MTWKLRWRFSMFFCVFLVLVVPVVAEKSSPGSQEDVARPMARLKDHDIDLAANLSRWRVEPWGALGSGPWAPQWVDDLEENHENS